MDYAKPSEVASAMVSVGRSELVLSRVDLIIRGGLAGAILAPLAAPTRVLAE
jgi:hypothetical protein